MGILHGSNYFNDILGSNYISVITELACQAASLGAYLWSKDAGPVSRMSSPLLSTQTEAAGLAHQEVVGLGSLRRLVSFRIATNL